MGGLNMELLIATAMAYGLSAGFIFGMLWAGRLTQRECDHAYVTGHVDGYAACEKDMGVDA
jgi:hypothetical protein